MSRIPYLSEDIMTAHQLRRARELWALRGRQITGPGAFYLYSPYLSECAEPMRLHMEQGTSLPFAMSELAILTTARHWSATYAWCRHSAHAAKAGIDKEAIAQIRDGGTPKFSDDRAETVYVVTRQLLQTGTLDDEVYERALALFGIVALTELVGEVGYASLVALANTTFEPDSPDGSQDYLPTGPAPRGPSAAPSDLSTLPAADRDVEYRSRLIGSAAASAWHRCPDIASRADHYDDVLRNHLTMPQTVSWAIFLMVARYWSARSMWPDLSRQALEYGVDRQLVDAVGRGERPSVLDPQQTIAYDFVGELIKSGRTSDRTFSLAREKMGLPFVVEVPAAVGFVSMISLTSNVFGPKNRALTT